MVSKEKIGHLIKVCDITNTKKENLPVLGLNKSKIFMPTAANINEVDLSKYKVVKRNLFVFSGMQTGRDVCIRIGLYAKDYDALVSPAYTTFYIDSTKVIPAYFYMFFNRKEEDRYGWFISDSSVRSNLDWDRFQDIEIPLPPIATQRQIVNAWKSLREVQEQNEAIAAPLMQVCQSYIQEARKKNYKEYRIGDAIKLIDKTNTENNQYDVLGLNKSKEFMPTVANTQSIDTKKYKVVEKGYFAFSGMQTGRDVSIRISYFEEEKPALISPAYTTFKIVDDAIIPEYFMLQFRNPEMDRLGWFYSDSSVRSNLDWNRFEEIRIPLPPLSIQQAIVNIYNCANEAKKIAAEADRMSREVCSALIQHAIHQ